MFETEPILLPDLFNDLPDRLARQVNLSPAGTSWSPPAVAELVHQAPVLSSLEIREEVVRRLGRGLSVDEGAWWLARIGDGLTQADLDASYATFIHGPPTAERRVGT